MKIKTLFNKFRGLKTKIINLINIKWTKSGRTHDKINFMNFMETQVNNIADSNGSEYYKKFNKPNVGIITDLFMYNYYNSAAELFFLTHENYKQIFKQVKLDYVLFVSCWKGIDDVSWKNIGSNKTQDKLFEIFEYAKNKKIKIIFQTIEDPSNYERFLPIAKKADYVFTTAIEKIDDYKKDVEHDNVYFLDYGVNPQFHNPIDFMKYRKPSLYQDYLFFAGSWVSRYSERKKDSKILFDGSLLHREKFIIADRNYYISGYDFPLKYQKYVIPGIEHSLLQKVHKLFNWTLNLNSIKYSETMCAMRVYELQALGTLLISNYSQAVYNKFPNIPLIFYPKEVSAVLNSFNAFELFEMQIEGIRNVFTQNTVFDKIEYIGSIIDKKEMETRRNVLVIVEDKNAKILEDFEHQTYPYKQLKLKKEVSKNDLIDCNYIAYFTETQNYKKNYIQDMINAFKFVDVSYVTINSHMDEDKIIKGNCHEYVNQYNDKYTTIFSLDANNYDDINDGKLQNMKGYSIDPLNILVDQKNKNDHQMYKLGVIVPTYNNGKFLLGKCFNSLKRSSLFLKMHIIIVDDGSDMETLEIIKDIEQKYSNVTTYFFPRGGSGSAARPRNKGVEISKEDYITFLDPDNEAINDAYSELFEKIVDNDYDFAFGDILKVDKRIKVLNYHIKSKKIKKPKKFLIKKRFKPQSIQAAIIKRDLMIKNKIFSPVGSIGQDTLLFQELMLNAEKALYIRKPVHIYYAGRSGSIVNSVNSSFFKKSLILEKRQVKIFENHGVKNKYYKKRFDYFMKRWYLPKLGAIKNEKEKSDAEVILNEIISLYER